MAAVMLGYPSTGGSSSSAASDPVEAAATTLTVGDWEDVNDFDANSTALTGLTQVGTGILLHPPTGTVYCAARLEDALGADDQTIVADLFLFRTEDATVAPGISVMLGISPGGLDGGTPSWYGIALECETKTLSTVQVKTWSRTGAALWAGVAGNTVDGRTDEYSARFALRRVGTEVFAYLVGDMNNLIQIGKFTGVATTAGDVFVRTESTGAGTSRYAQIKLLSTTGLTVAGGQLVAAS